MYRFSLLLIVFLAGIASCNRPEIDPAILGMEIAIEEALRPVTISSKIVDGRLQVDIIPQGPIVCCCPPCLQPSYSITAKYEVQIAAMESGPYRPFMTIRINDKEQEKTHSITLPNSLTKQPLILRAVAISKSGKAGYVQAIMNSTSPLPSSINELVISEKDELSSLSISPVRQQIAYVTYVQDAAFNLLPTLRLADYAQGKLLNAHVITPGGFSPTFSRDGNQLAYFLPRQTASASQSFVIRNLATKDDQVIQIPTELWIGSFTWSPDGKWLAILEQNNEYTRLWKVNTTDGKLMAITPTMPYKEPGGIWQGSIDWSPDGKTIVVTRSIRNPERWQFGLSLISPDNGVFVSDVKTLAGWADRSPSYSPDGQKIVFVSSRASGSHNYHTIWVRNMVTNQLRHIRLPDSFQLSDTSLPKWVGANALVITVYTGNPIKLRYFFVSL